MENSNKDTPSPQTSANIRKGLKSEISKGHVLLGGTLPIPNTNQKYLSDFETSKDNFTKKERSIFLLSEGLTIQKTATILNEKYDTIKKRAYRAVRNDILIKEPFRMPSIYTKGINYTQWLDTTKKKKGQVSLGGRKTINITCPHRFGVQYYYGSNSYKKSLNLQGLKRRYHLSGLDERDNLSAIWDTKILTIWVKKFKRGTPEEKIKDGLNTAREYAEAHNAAGARLRFKRLLGRIEWIIENQNLSDFVREFLKIKKGEFLQINNTQWGIDKSHPDNIEINKLGNYPEDAPTEAVKIMQFLVDKDQLLTTLKVMKERLEQQDTEMMVRDQKINILEAKIRNMEMRK